MSSLKKKIIVGICALLGLVVVIFFLIEISIYYYLKQYGYGFGELYEASAVYFTHSDGITIGSEDNYSVFIGAHDYIYDDVVSTKGFELTDQMGEGRFYNNGEDELCIVASASWCYWFRIYHMSDGYYIEDF